jgi:hypothetical protein
MPFSRTDRFLGALLSIDPIACMVRQYERLLSSMLFVAAAIFAAADPCPAASALTRNHATGDDYSYCPVYIDSAMLRDRHATYSQVLRHSERAKASLPHVVSVEK